MQKEPVQTILNVARASRRPRHLRIQRSNSSHSICLCVCRDGANIFNIKKRFEDNLQTVVMRLYTKMSDNTKQVRVDNWGIFFLQRLQTFFSKTDYCDMTLQFEGNVQLKVHRLVMNACTDYFHFLEQTCTVEDNVIMMPADLQSDVIVPIVNFMYTGMLEFQLSIFDRLYKTAQVMNISILTKLLDAQKQPLTPNVKNYKKKVVEASHTFNVPVKKVIAKPTLQSELPATLPGRKLPVWKRKSVPTSQPYTHNISPFAAEPKWSASVDPLSVPDNTPKPTRFDWPEDELPSLPLMETSFEEISYTSKPLMTQEEENRASTSFDDLKHIPNANRSSSGTKKQSSSSLDMEEMKNYVKEQKIRSGLSHDDEIVDNELEEYNSNDSTQSGVKRKLDVKAKTCVKKVRFDEQDGKSTTINIAADGKTVGDLNHSKIVTEILKKYPQLVKKNKNIRLKIMAKGKTSPEQAKVESIQIRTPRLKTQNETSKSDGKGGGKFRGETDVKSDDKGPWMCDRCSTPEEPIEFVLYYLYRKHMTDVHNEKFDSRLCKYCGHRCNKHNLLMYHLYTKHGMKPPPAYSFPKCSLCPFIALSQQILNKHKRRHGKNEIQCIECKLAFTSQTTLTSHMQITGHTGKSTKNNYDCQYCTKRYQSGVNLFSHVRMQHRNEAIRDGIVSIDEVDDVEDLEDLDEETEKEEYILPEILSETAAKKVNILSNVKVQERNEQQQTLALEPSSEAEALNNVATGIATSLGLVDIVVLNDNQQLYLQQDEQTFGNQQNEQPEFILPELTGRETFVQNQNEVITTDGVITQSMLSGGDIGSTDELVMVLTDHDYGDNQEEINSDGSNIVVLYSHPVDGQQDQYITSQGNIMVNSQTGMIEIRNGATITSAAGQVVMNPQDTHIESIEMIQREIESHGEMKHESLYVEDNKADLVTEKDQQPPAAANEPEESQQELNDNRDDMLMADLTQNEHEDLEANAVENLENIEGLATPLNTDVTETIDEVMECEEPLDPIPQINEEITDKPENVTNDGEESHGDGVVDDVQAQIIEEEKPDEAQDDKIEQAAAAKEEESCSDKGNHEENTEMVTDISELEKPPESKPDENVDDTVESSTQSESEPQLSESDVQLEPDPQVVDNNEDVEMKSQEEKTENEEEKTENEEEKTEDEKNNLETPIEEPAHEQRDYNVTETAFEEKQDDQDLTQLSTDETPPSDTSTSQFNDDNSQSSQESQGDSGEQTKEKETLNHSTKISILDDWEDTDSQQSDHKETNKVSGETVNKLMDDWEEEEEEDVNKKDNE